MSEKLVECVPNFSEGRNTGVIKQITDAVESVEGIRLLDVDPGPDMNRTVVTFVGSPDAVGEAAFQAIKTASELIDMSQHTGSHPRMGATDVCPFVPVSGISVKECVKLSMDVARRVGDDLKIPVYLYEKSAQKPERQNLAVVRKGEYEALQEKLKKPEWKPDFGPAEFNARSGATVIGVREFLIAYNISLNTREPRYATDIAFELRAKGRSARRGNIDPVYLWGEEILKYKKNHYPCGKDDFVGKTIEETVKHCKTEHSYDLAALLKLHGVDPDKPEGESVKIPGKFQHCKSIGWLVKDYDRAQISINLTDYNVTSMYHVFDESRKLAADRGIEVTGSEIVGMVPYPALLDCGIYYLKKQGRSAGIPVRDILETAVQSLGLRDVNDFKIEDRVLGLPKNLDGALVEMKVTDFVDEVSRDSAAPGGGSIAALSGALGASLASMVSNLTANKRGSQKVDKVLNEAAEQCQEIKTALVRGIDDDTNAFNAYMQAIRLPGNTPEKKKEKLKAVQNSLKKAVSVPLNTANLSLRAIEITETVAKYGNPASITDVGVGAQISLTGVMGGIYNVLINLKDITDRRFNDKMRKQCTELEKKARTIVKRIEKMVDKEIK
ncbi:glutamate formimidoyltransferase [candidate division KSB1 bacterium]|nr:glutamate formimidoyltransferase [candidate division KSB1 bacterium]